MVPALHLESLVTKFRPGVTPAKGAELVEAIMVCLDSQGHKSLANLVVTGDFPNTYNIALFPITDQMRRTHNDEEDATEQGAYGVSILLVDENTPYVALERSRKGTRFDYWLSLKEDKGPYFQRKARLEVSGIRRATEAAFKARLKKKLEQLAQSHVHLPGYVSIVEFGTPMAQLVKR